MALDRVQIMAAVEKRLTDACPSLKKITRSPQLFSQASESLHPLALLLSGDEQANRTTGRPPLWTLSPSVHVYARNAKSKAAPDEQLDALKREVEAAFERQDGEQVREQWQTTLGGLVARCWVTSTSSAQGLEEAEVRVDLEILAVGT